jgi:hypothetical protein
MWEREIWRWEHNRKSGKDFDGYELQRVGVRERVFVAGVPTGCGDHMAENCVSTVELLGGFFPTPVLIVPCGALRCCKHRQRERADGSGCRSLLVYQQAGAELRTRKLGGCRMRDAMPSEISAQSEAMSHKS